ncbi:Sucrose transport protein SUT5 [Hordeum vulgare]|nr:Sucrose transport protein SUT5 [Hordeum vulgare]
MAAPGESGGHGNGGARRKNVTAAVRLFLVCMVSGGIQYISALEMSLLSPYSQNLGIPHKYASMIWIGGPIAGFLMSIFMCSHLSTCVLCPLYLMRKMCVLFLFFSTYTGPRWAATAVYVVGFLLLDCVIHTAQASVRALMSDLSAANYGPNVGQAIFTVWMAIGSILGYTAVAYGTWHRWFPSLKTSACCEACADLKGAFLTAVVLIIICTVVTMLLADEQSLDGEDVGTSSSSAQTCGGLKAFTDLFTSLKNMSPAMFRVLALTAVTWLSWFPFLQYNTDWMGREIYRGNPSGTADMADDKYNAVVREGAIGLLLCSASLGAMVFIFSEISMKFINFSRH